MSLQTAIDRALGANRGLESTRYARDAEELTVLASQSEFDVKVVPASTLGRVGNNSFSPETSGTNSSLGAQLRKKFEWGTVVSVGPSYNRYGNTSNTGLNASVRQPLTHGFDRDVVLDGVRRAEFTFASSDRAHKQARVKVALETVAVYHDAIRHQRLAQISEALGERLRRHTLVTSRKEKAGLSGPSDTFRAQIRLKDAEDSAYQYRASFEIAKGRLRQLLALPATTDIRLSEPPVPRWDASNAQQLAFDHAPELRQLREEIEEAKRAVRIASNMTLPDVSLNVSYGQTAFADPLLQSFIPTTQRQWSVYVQAVGDLSRTAEKLNYRRALMRVEALEVATEDKMADIQREVEQQLRTLDNARARMGLRGEQIRQAEGKLALAEVKFAHDMADNFEMIEAESDLHRARIELAAGEAEYFIAAYALKAMTGQFL